MSHESPAPVRSPASAPAPTQSLVERLGDPQTEEKLHRILDRLDKLEAMIDALGTFGQRLPVITEAVGSGAAWAYDEAKIRGVHPIEAGQRAAEVALQAAHPEMMDALERLLAKRSLLLKLVDVLDELDEEDVSAVSTALVETRKQPTQMVTPLMAIFKLGDPDIQRTIGFTLELAKRIGAVLRRTDPPD